MVDIAGLVLNTDNFPWFALLVIGVFTVIVGFFAIIAYIMDSRAKYRMITMLLENVEKGKNWEIEVGNVKIKSAEA